LSTELCQLAEEKFKSRFSSVDELLTAILNQLLVGEALIMDEGEQRLLEERLKALGYI
jgi:hypothetical protein